jgi:PAS domain-containing protein
LDLLGELHAKLDALSKSQAVIEFNVDGTIITANENFLNALGYRLDEIQGKHHSLFVDRVIGIPVSIESSGLVSAAASFRRLNTSG